MIDLLLINIETPENVGLIYRLAFQFNIRHIYIYKCSKSGKTNTYKTERHIPIKEVESLDFLNDYINPKYLLETGGSILNNKVILADDFLIAIANESHGATDKYKSYFDNILTLNAPNQKSYNVSHALAIGLYLVTYK
jgi:tRNA G18 (ribose-2'-O)-methylase SpoU